MYRFTLPLLVISVLGPAPTSAQTRPIDSVTVPMRVEGNRAFVDLTFTRADGTKRSARFWIDTGGDGFLLTETLARDLGLNLETPEQEGGKEFAPVTPTPQPSLGDLPLEVVDGRVLVVVGSDNLLPKAAPGHADGMIPGHVLARYHVIIDYPNGSFILAKPGVIKPTGDPLRMPVSRHLCFPRTEVVVAGEKYGLLLDTGASFTVVSEAVLKAGGATIRDGPGTKARLETRRRSVLTPLRPCSCQTGIGARTRSAISALYHSPKESLSVT